MYNLEELRLISASLSKDGLNLQESIKTTKNEQLKMYREELLIKILLLIQKTQKKMDFSAKLHHSIDYKEEIAARLESLNYKDEALTKLVLSLVKDIVTEK